MEKCHWLKPGLVATIEYLDHEKGLSKMSSLSTWGSVERLSYWLSIIRWLPAIAGGITVIAAVAVALVSNRPDTLRAERAANRHLSQTHQQEIAHRLIPFAGTLYTIRA
jgi:hypothetical protein